MPADCELEIPSTFHRTKLLQKKKKKKRDTRTLLPKIKKK